MCGGLISWGQVHVPQAAIQNMSSFLTRGRGSGGWWKGCDQLKSHLNGKEHASTTGLQAEHQLPVQGCMRRVKNRNKRKKRGGGISLWKGKSGGLEQQLSECGKERKEGRSWVSHPLLQTKTLDSALTDCKEQPGRPPPSFDLLILIGHF